MKSKSTIAAAIIVTSMFAVVGTLQANCLKHPSGWHMVSKKCHFKPAENWQEYTSGKYIQPMMKNNLF